MRNKWLPLVAICLGTFMLLIDVTIVNVALPAMSVDLHASFSSLQWVMDIYALVLAALLLGVGAISDILGRRHVYITGLLLFAAASLASGLAGNDTILIIARGVQGVGAAAMFATTIALINSSYHHRERGIAYGIWGAVSGAAAALGPITGGLLTEHLSWRWIFFVNLPVSAIAVTLALITLAGGRGDHRARLDIAGVLTFTVSASLLTYAFIKAGTYGWASTRTISLIAAGIVVMIGFVFLELRTTHPLIDLHLFKDRRFTGVMLVALTFNLAAFSYLAYSSIWLQSVLHLSPVAAGLVYLPMSLTSFVVSAALGRVLHGTDPRWLIAGGMFLVGAGGFAQGLLGSSSRWPSLLIGLFLVGVGVGLISPTMASAIMSAVPIQRSGMASGGMSTFRQLGFAFGIALLGTIFQSRIAATLADHGVPSAHGIAAAISGGQSAAVLKAAPAQYHQQLLAAIHSGFASGLNTIFIVSGVVAVVVAILAAVLLRPETTVSEASAPAVSAPATT